MQDEQWYEGIVLRGDQYGRTLGFPTANLDPAILKDIERGGVYAAEVRLDQHNYRGALYLGPRLVLNETKRVLEIHLLDFNDEIYGQTLRFQLGEFIREPMNFDSLAELKARLMADAQAVRSLNE